MLILHSESLHLHSTAIMGGIPNNAHFVPTVGSIVGWFDLLTPPAEGSGRLDDIENYVPTRTETLATGMEYLDWNHGGMGMELQIVKFSRCWRSPVVSVLRPRAELTGDWAEETVAGCTSPGEWNRDQKRQDNETIMFEAIMFAHTKFQMRIYACNHVYCLKLVDM